MIDIIEALDCKKYCAALFIDLSKAFDTVDHIIWTEKLHRIGLSQHAIMQFSNYLFDRTQSVQFAGSSLSFLPEFKGVPQGSILESLLFSISVNNICDNILDAAFHLYADDTVIYGLSSSVVQTFAFDVVQSQG